MRRKRERDEGARGWRKLLKEDFDGDWICIVKILKYKLERTRKCIVGNNIIMDAKKVGAEIRKVEDLLGRLLDDPYHDEAFADFHRRHGKPKMVFNDASKEERAKNPHVGGSIEFLYRGKVATEEMHKEMRALYKIEAAMRQGDLREALKIIEVGLDGTGGLMSWWD